MRAYLAFIRTTFLNKMVYRFEHILGVVNTTLQILITVTIWKALYSGGSTVDGITLPMVVTSIIIGQGLSNSYIFNDLAVSKRVKDGSIINVLLKPISFRVQLFAENVGNILFRLVVNFTPSLIISILFFGIIPPKSILSLILFVVSVILGFLVLWTLSSIVQHSAFWIMNTWSISTIKNVFVRVLSGAVLPLWFMPEGVLKVISFTPFDSIYFIPVKIYLGQISLNDVWFYYGKQIIWIVLLYLLSTLLWNKGQKRVVVQGG